MVKEAREIILYFATLMRHGLIPNLIDPPRYNSRDATMWYIKAIKDYIEETQDWDILKVKVEMRFLSSSREKHDDLTKKNMIREQTLVDVLQEILERHANGIKFIEWDHKQIDEHMTYEGHNIDLWPDWTTGFVLGGNKYNCLTWMDKMGSSEKSGNKGIPASSRDGAPIDMTALLYLAVNFMKTLYDLEYSPHNQVEILQKKKTITYAHWANLIKENFEKNYWVPLNPENDGAYANHPELIRRRGIYKDSIKSGFRNSNYYLRPNALVALGVCPNLFNMENAAQFLQLAESLLIRPNSIGVKTLDPWEDIYRATYNNNDNSEDWTVSQGFNYHNGPEWVWLYGFYLMAVKNVEHSKGNI